MIELGILAAALLLGAVLGAGVIWFMHRNAEAAARADVAELSAAVSALTHDLRGALSPSLLMAERLERHGDPAVRQAGETISKAMDRATSLCRDASTNAKRYRQHQTGHN